MTPAPLEKLALQELPMPMGLSEATADLSGSSIIPVGLPKGPLVPAALPS